MVINKHIVIEVGIDFRIIEVKPLRKISNLTQPGSNAL